MKGRGVLSNVSNRLKVKYKKLTGEEFDTKTLRLCPYVMLMAMDQHSIDRSQVDDREKEILKCWTKQNLCICYPFFDPVQFPNKDFYQLITQILYEGYILHDLKGN